MRLGINVPLNDTDLAVEAERHGFEVAFVPEGFRSDAASALGYLAARTTRIHVAAGVFQIPARTAAMTVMTAATLDGLSGGRFRLGLGVSNAFITEGWYGLPFGRPLARTREYVSVVRAALAGRQVDHQGEHLRVPLPGGRGTGFRLHAPLVNPRIPIYLAAVGERGLELAGEISDGWFGVFSSPGRVAEAIGHLKAGRRRGDLAGEPFEVIPSVSIAVEEDLEAAALPVKHHVARFVSLGHRTDNFYFRLLERLGHGEAAVEIQDRARSGDSAGAAAAVPFDFVDSVSLLGPPDRVAERMDAYARAGVTTLALSPVSSDPAARRTSLQVAAEAIGLVGSGR
ncbi:LLM class flavin-dependent oxidoreductase [Nonomuraea cavernae]|uniref:LLM class F420-dependent oxidoreductase n=1 Tax=Nonomuraea cavernae TaxID=2045107 RepID=A0A917ZGN0_9ACTN|nr:LLM class flavin-dependent oxidoreductase [Nonomuraea cavernae]MCA2189484.1 LLM class flavin-dependent oxidoreductase [Nonomuraea cavernae]GGO82132.1 LLM class F420-dependent oxidoreductase [Nonomuraea cavernae]